AHAAAPKKPPPPKVLLVGEYHGKRGTYSTRQKGSAAAHEGDWILIGPGDYKQSSATSVSGGEGDDRAPADILITMQNIHLRGMDRNAVMIDGTKPGSPQCSSAVADQTFGPPEEGAFAGNNGVVV